MNAQRTFIYNKYISFDRKSRSIIIITVIFLLALYLSFFYKKDYFVLPAQKTVSVTSYTDSVDGGKSIIKSYSFDSSVNISFVLQQGFVRPYVGITLNNKNGECFDISDYNEIQLEIKAKDLKNVIFYLATQNTNNRVNKKEIYYSSTIELQKNKHLYLIDINSFNIPDWWYDINKFTKTESITTDWTQCSQMSIASGLPPKMGTIHHFQIQSIIFKKNNTKAIIYFLLILLSIIILLFLKNIYKFHSKKNKEIIIHYKPIDLPLIKNVTDDHFAYINKHFDDSNLSLEIISKNTGINQRQISDDIYEKYKCNFKTYINRIRITEAQRLLKETELNISEIAYNVGYSSPNNINRVFKKHT